MTKINLRDKWELFERIVADDQLGDGEKVVAFRLLAHLNNSSGLCNPSYERIAAGCGKSRRRVMELIAKLEGRGWIEIEHSKGGDPKSSNRHLANTYAFDFEGSNANPTSAKSRTSAGVSTSAKSRTTTSAKSRTTTSARLRNETSARSRTQTQEVEHGKLNTVSKHTGETASPPGEARPPPPTFSGDEDASASVKAEDAFASFEEFWRYYPRDAKPKTARAAWNKALKHGHSPQEIILGAMRFAEERQGEPVRYTPHAANWLAEERWLEAPPVRPAGHDLPEMSVRDVIRMVRSGQ